MLTPTELKNKQFSRAMFGGYSMPEVDRLLDRLAPDYETAYNENAELRKKVELLLSRIETFEAQEDSIKAAILNAQRMCDNIVAQAKQQAVLIEQDAKAKAERLAEEAERNIVDKRREYEAICNEVTEFRNGLVEMYRAHLDKIREIPAFTEEQEPAEPEIESEDASQTDPGVLPVPPKNEPASVVEESVANPAQGAPVDMEVLEQRIAQQFSDLEKTMEFTLPRGEAAAPAAEQTPSAEVASEMVELLEDPSDLPTFAPDGSEQAVGIGLDLSDSLQFGEEFDLAIGKRTGGK